MIHKDFSCEFYFIRHGESESNATPGFAAGVNFDAPLTPKGYEQAQLLGERLKRDDITFDRLYSSSMTRTIQTTETMLEAMGESGRDYPKVDAIIEQQMPGWRGVPTDEVMTAEMIAYMRGKGGHFVPPEGESHRMVQRRYATWLENEILYNQNLVTKEQSLRIGIVGHGQSVHRASRAIARPMPRPAPVTTATLPSKRFPISIHLHKSVQFLTALRNLLIILVALS